MGSLRKSLSFERDFERLLGCVRLIGRLFFKLSESTQLFLGCRLDGLTSILK